MSLLLPYRQVTAPKTDVSAADTTQKVRFTRRFSGFGDAVVMAQLLAKSPQPKSPLLVGVGFGFRLPTGASQPNHEWAGGLSRDPVLQVGAGTLDPIGSLSAGYRFGRTSVFASALARISSSANIHSYRFGNEYQATASMQRPISTWFDASLTAAAIITGHDYDKGVQVGNTGGTWLYLTPGLTFRSGDINTGFSLQLPLYQNVNLSQLSSSYVFNVNFSCGFNFKKSVAEDSNLMSRRASSTMSGRVDGFTGFQPERGHKAPDVETISLGSRVRLERYTQKDKVTLFEFYGDKCLACAAFESPLREYLTERPDIVLRKINIGDGNSEVVKQFNITVTPTLIALDDSGAIVLRKDGASTETLIELSKRLKE